MKAPRPRSFVPQRLVALTPLWLFLVLAVRGSFWNPFFSAPPSIAGVPLGLVVLGLCGLWMLLGLVIVWDTRSAAMQALGLLLFTLPATMLLVMGPAMVLIIQNLE